MATRRIPSDNRIGRAGNDEKKGEEKASPKLGGAIPWESRLVSEARRVLGVFPKDHRRFGEKGRNNGELFTPGELDDAAKDLLALQRGLTGGRDLIGSSYMDERQRLSSYLLFYWHITRAQMLGLLNMAFPVESPLEGRENPLRILDLGAGPAPCSIAAAEWFAAGSTSITACDQSALALECGKRLAEAAGYRFRAIPKWDAFNSLPPEGTFDIIVMGHLLNELWSDTEDKVERRRAFVEEAANKLADDGLLIILEPALLVTSRDTLDLRDRLVSSGLTVLAPCLRNGPCPALILEGQSCHSDFAWEPPRLVRELAERTGLDKDLVKTTAFVFSKSVGRGQESKDAKKAGNDSKCYRVVSEPMRNKAGRVRLLICGEEGRFPLSAKPGEGFPAESIFRTLTRSDHIKLVAPAVRESGLALGPETRITRKKIPVDASRMRG